MAFVEKRKYVRRQADREVQERAAWPQDRRVDEASKAYRHKRRRAIRHNCQVQMALKMSQTGGGALDTWNVSEHPIKGRILDLSVEGCSVFSAFQLDIGQELSLVLDFGRLGIVNTLGAIRWCKDVKRKDGHAAGVLFARLEAKDTRLIDRFLNELDENIGL